MAVTFGFMPTALGAVRYWVADTAAELPTTAPAAEGDHGYAKDTDLTYRYGGVSWVAQVLTTDSRLTDARVPTAHAASHVAAGSDPLVLSAGQTTTGQFAMARLASGVADGTKFIRDDGTLQPVTATAPDVPITKIAPASNVTITAGYSAHVAPYYEFASGITTEIGDGANLEIG